MRYKIKPLNPEMSREDLVNMVDFLISITSGGTREITIHTNPHCGHAEGFVRDNPDLFYKLK